MRYVSLKMGGGAFKAADLDKNAAKRASKTTNGPKATKGGVGAHCKGKEHFSCLKINCECQCHKTGIPMGNRASDRIARLKRNR